MSATLTAARLPSHVRVQLDERLRGAAYGDTVAMADWLKELGHPIGKSSVNRYAVRLRSVDAKAGGVAAVLMTPAKPRASRSADRRAEIMAELLRLQGLQTALLAELAAISAPA